MGDCALGPHLFLTSKGAVVGGICNISGFYTAVVHYHYALSKWVVHYEYEYEDWKMYCFFSLLFLHGSDSSKTWS